jgi:hypothetical protein
MEPLLARYVQFVGVLLMAGFALHPAMFPAQGKFRVPVEELVSGNLVETLRSVALRTRVREFAEVRIFVAGVARGKFDLHEFYRLPVVELLVVALLTVDLGMLPGERILRLSMVKLRGRLPLHIGVACFA